MPFTWASCAWSVRGQVSGVIERAATGAKEAFQGVEAVGRVIAGMVEREGVGPLARPMASTTRGVV